MNYIELENEVAVLDLLPKQQQKAAAGALQEQGMAAAGYTAAGDAEMDTGN